MQYSDEHLRYLRLLSQKYQTVAAAASEIIRIEALLRLPKGTEHFMSDLHGEHEAFVHILNSASGVIREKIDTVLGNGVPAEERAELATLVYYPNQKLPELKARQRDLHAWYRMTLLRLIDLCRFVSSKHTRDHVRRCLPQNCGYILDELLHAHFEDHDKDQYYGEIIESIIRYDRADAASARSSSGWLWTACTLWATCLTAARARTAFWTVSWRIIRWTSSGATTTWSGWARQRAARSAL